MRVGYGRVFSAALLVKYGLVGVGANTALKHFAKIVDLFAFVKFKIFHKNTFPSKIKIVKNIFFAHLR